MISKYPALDISTALPFKKSWKITSSWSTSSRCDIVILKQKEYLLYSKTDYLLPKHLSVEKFRWKK